MIINPKLSNRLWRRSLNPKKKHGRKVRANTLVGNLKVSGWSEALSDLSGRSKGLRGTESLNEMFFKIKMPKKRTAVLFINGSQQLN